MKLVVFGASGPTGLQVVQQALDRGHDVTAAVRRPDDFPLAAARLRLVRVDAVDLETVERAVAGQQAVVSVLGGKYTRKPVSVFSTGITNILSAMATHRVERLACVSSVCVAGKAAPGETFLFRNVLLPVLLTLGRTAYSDMARMEDIVENSTVNWTIMRASGLFDATRITDYTIAPSGIPGRYTSRADLADALLGAATDGLNPKARVDVITTDRSSRGVHRTRDAL